jgi:uncharacterized protein (TIGR02217 family)
MSFHEVRFPTAISRGASGGPERRTEIVVLGSGHEERNSRWADSRRSYNAGYGIRSLDDLYAVIAFFEERRGRLHGFRFKDHADFSSAATLSIPVAPDDQAIGTGDGATAVFQLRKRYGSGFAPYERTISKPAAGTVRVAVAGAELTIGTQFSVDTATGRITFLPGHVPSAGAAITAGFEFDVPVRFESDRLEINVESFKHGSIPAIGLVEVRV